MMKDVQDLYTVHSVQIQPRKHVPDDADRTAPTRQHELLDHTDHPDLPRNI